MANTTTSSKTFEPKTAELTTVAEPETNSTTKLLAQLETILRTAAKNFGRFAVAAIITFIGMFFGPSLALAQVYGEPLKHRSGSVLEAAGIGAAGGMTLVISLWGIYFIGKTIIDVIRTSRH